MVAGMVCDKGNADDLAFLYQQTIDAKVWPQETRLKVLDLLIDAAQNRKVVPAAICRHSRISCSPANLAGRRTAVEGDSPGRLVESKIAGRRSAHIALSSPNLSRQQTAAIESLGVVGGPESKTALEKLAAAGQPLPLRYRVIVRWRKSMSTPPRKPPPRRWPMARRRMIPGRCSMSF